MGRWKDQIDDNEQELAIGQAIALAAEVLVSCDLHPDRVLVNTYNEDGPAYALGNWMVTNEHEQVSVFEGDRKRVRKAIQRGIEEALIDCPDHPSDDD